MAGDSQSGIGGDGSLPCLDWSEDVASDTPIQPTPFEGCFLAPFCGPALAGVCLEASAGFGCIGMQKCIQGGCDSEGEHSTGEPAVSSDT